MTVKDVGMMALNYLGSLTGWWGNFYQKAALEKRSPEEQAKHASDYRLSLGLGDAALPNAGGIEAYIGARLRNIDNFSKITAPNGKSIADALSAGADPAAADGVKEAISNALTLTQKTQKATADFKANLDRVTTAIKAPDAKFHPEDLVSYLQELKGTAHKAIAEQHAKEQADLKALFQDRAADGFVNKLKASLGVDDSQIQTIEREMLSTLESAQTKELEEFDKSMDEPITNMHTAAQKERDRVTFLATIYNNNEAMKKKIDELYLANLKKEGAHAEISLGQEGKNFRARFKGIDIKDLPLITTVTGKEIKQSPPGSFYIDLPHRWLFANYYHSSNAKLEADMMTLAAAIRASGHSKITMTVDHKDPDHALELGRKAYEACLETGFEGKNITIKVNGKQMKPDELFQDCPSRLHEINVKAAANAKSRDEADRQSHNEVTYERFKSTLEAGRLNDATAQEPTPDIHQSSTPTA